MKFALIGVLALCSFLGTLIGVMAMTGNLNGKALGRLMGAAPESSGAKPAEGGHEGENASEPLAAPPPALDSLTRQMKEKEAALAKKEEELKQKEAQLNTREAELQKLRTEVESMQKQVQGSFDNAETDRQVRMKTVALTIAQMKPDKAAERLQGLPPEDIADILMQMEAKNRGKIMEALKPELAVSVMRNLQGKSN